MRSWFAALLALALGACATGGGKLDDPTVKKVPGQVAEGIFHCSGPSGPRQYAKCDNVPIVVLLKAPAWSSCPMPNCMYMAVVGLPA